MSERKRSAADTDARRRPPGRPRGRTSVIADRETLLAAAERLIRREGPDVSLGAVAIEAGVTKPIIYRGVGDRDALAYALAERLTARLAAEVEERVAAAAGPRDALRCLIRGYLECAGADRHLYLYVSAGGAGADRIRHALLLADGAAARFAERIAAYRQAQGADGSVATVWSYALVGALHYVTLWWLRDDTASLEDATDHTTALLWPGFEVKAPPETAPGAPTSRRGRRLRS